MNLTLFDALISLVMLGGVIALFALAWTQWRRARREERRRAPQHHEARLRQWASERGYSFGDPEPGLWSELQRFELLDRGRADVSRMAKGSIDGTSLLIFHCAYMGPPRPARNARHLGRGYRHSMTVFCFQRPGVALPHFVADAAVEKWLKQEWATGGAERIGPFTSRITTVMSAFAGRLLWIPDPPGLDFYPADPGFREVYRVRAAVGDEESFWQLFSPRLLASLRTQPGWVIEGRGDRVMLARTIALTRTGSQLEPQAVPDSSWPLDGYLTPAEIDEWLPRGRELADTIFAAERP
jgi:hypothetical protein